MDNEKTVNEIESTVQAFSEWLDTNSDDYMMLVTKGDDTFLAAYGKNDNIVKALVCGMMRNENIQNIIIEAARMIEAKKLVDKLKNYLK